MKHKKPIVDNPLPAIEWHVNDATLIQCKLSKLHFLKNTASISKNKILDDAQI